MDRLDQRIHMAKVRAAEEEVVASLPALLGVTPEEFARRMNAPYVWPTVDGVRCPQGTCSWCCEPGNERACDFSCVGV
jgi:hypothetical protein